jgi:superfamily I DNA/RNA helicase
MPVPKKPEEFIHCPICDDTMVKRQGMYGEFWGCCKFPRCRGTRKIGEETLEPTTKYTKYAAIKKAPGSEEQEAIWEYMLKGRGHLVINAGPGVGKTWVGVQGCLRMPSTKSIFFIAYNKHIATEAQGKLRASGCGNVEAMTFHSLGLRIIRNNFPTAQISDSKMEEILVGLNPAPVQTSSEQMAEWRRTLNLAEKLCGLVKNYNVDYAAEGFQAELEKLADHHGIDLNGVYPKAFTLLVPALDECKARVGIAVDFDDMIWLPVVLDLRIRYACDIIFTDESQDLNVVQHELIFRATKPTSRVFVVGDRRQSIYGFRGAHTASMDELKRRLAATAVGVKEFPMTITYRCPKSHVVLAQAISPDIRALDDAPEGVIEEMEYKKAVDAMQPGDMVMCRVNAKLIECAYGLIKRNIRPLLKGRDIGAGLLALVDKLEKSALKLQGNEMSNLLAVLNQYRFDEQTKLLALGDKAKGRVAALSDKCDCLCEFIANSKTIKDMRYRIETLFEKANDTSADDKVNTVVLGTVHRTKGLEAERVFILAPELIPHPATRQAWEMEQETNIAWVAATRAKFNRATGAPGTLIFCGAIPDIYLKAPEPPVAPEPGRVTSPDLEPVENDEPPF